MATFGDNPALARICVFLFVFACAERGSKVLVRAQEEKKLKACIMRQNDPNHKIDLET